MRLYFLFSLTYFSIAAIAVTVTREGGVSAIQSTFVGTGALAIHFWKYELFLILGGAVLVKLTRKSTLKQSIPALVYAFFGALIFQMAFMLVKTSMPYIVPFYADVTFANWDHALHGGRDAWEITHMWAQSLPMDYVVPIYFTVWIMFALFLPIIVFVTDVDVPRSRRTLILLVVAWILIGNVFALAGMSAGPVYFDRIYGGDRFAELTDIIAVSPPMSIFFRIQEALWTAYTTNGQTIGAGISAFPSVHVSIATVSAIYMWERSRLLGMVGAAFLLTILFLSIYSGYHYAIDGYVSIAVMWGIWAAMRRWPSFYAPDTSNETVS